MTLLLCANNASTLPPTIAFRKKHPRNFHHSTYSPIFPSPNSFKIFSIIPQQIGW